VPVRGLALSAQQLAALEGQGGAPPASPGAPAMHNAASTMAGSVGLPHGGSASDGPIGMLASSGLQMLPPSLQQQEAGAPMAAPPPSTQMSGALDSTHAALVALAANAQPMFSSTPLRQDAYPVNDKQTAPPPVSAAATQADNSRGQQSMLSSQTFKYDDLR